MFQTWHIPEKLQLPELSQPLVMDNNSLIGKNTCKVKRHSFTIEVNPHFICVFGIICISTLCVLTNFTHYCLQGTFMCPCHDLSLSYSFQTLINHQFTNQAFGADQNPRIRNSLEIHRFNDSSTPKGITEILRSTILIEKRVKIYFLELW